MRDTAPVQASRRLGVPKALYRLIRLPPRLVYAAGLGRFLGPSLLLLATTGRRTGARRITPLQYERVGSDLVVASARGAHADWYRNLLADPRVEVKVGRDRFAGLAEATDDTREIADFLELRLQRHPRMIGGLLRAGGLPRRPTRRQLEAYAAGLTLVTIRRVRGAERSGP